MADVPHDEAQTTLVHSLTLWRQYHCAVESAGGETRKSRQADGTQKEKGQQNFCFYFKENNSQELLEQWRRFHNQRNKQTQTSPDEFCLECAMQTEVEVAATQPYTLGAHEYIEWVESGEFLSNSLLS